MGEILPVDDIFGGYDPSAHFNDDMFNNNLENIKRSIGISLKEDYAFYGVSKSLQANVPSQLSRFETSLLRFKKSFDAFSRSDSE